jgi:hypothetical protein
MTVENVDISREPRRAITMSGADDGYKLYFLDSW